MSASTQWMDEVRVLTREMTRQNAPAHSWERIAARLDSGDVVLLPMARPARFRWRPAAAAAGLLLCAGVAAALVPQTGLRAWIERQLGGDSPVETGATTPAASAQLAVPAVAGAVRLDLTGVLAPLQLRVRLTDARDLTVTAGGAAASAQFIAGAGRLTIDGAAGGEIVVDLPRSAGRVTIAVDGVSVVDARGAQITVLAPRADTIGTELIVPIR